MMRREVMNMMWDLIRKANLTKSQALKKAWKIVKELSSKAETSQDKAIDLISQALSKNQWRCIEELNLPLNNKATKEYKREGRIGTSNWKVWSNYGKTRVYFNYTIDLIVITVQKYIEV